MELKNLNEEIHPCPKETWFSLLKGDKGII
jgi:hypothetical protein